MTKIDPVEMVDSLSHPSSGWRCHTTKPKGGLKAHHLRLVNALDKKDPVAMGRQGHVDAVGFVG